MYNYQPLFNFINVVDKTISPHISFHTVLRLVLRLHFFEHLKFNSERDAMLQCGALTGTGTSTQTEQV